MMPHPKRHRISFTPQAKDVLKTMCIAESASNVSACKSVLSMNRNIKTRVVARIMSMGPADLQAATPSEVVLYRETQRYSLYAKQLCMNVKQCPAFSARMVSVAETASDPDWRLLSCGLHMRCRQVTTKRICSRCLASLCRILELPLSPTRIADMETCATTLMQYGVFQAKNDSASERTVERVRQWLQSQKQLSRTLQTFLDILKLHESDPKGLASARSQILLHEAPQSLLRVLMEDKMFGGMVEAEVCAKNVFELLKVQFDAETGDVDETSTSLDGSDAYVALSGASDAVLKKFVAHLADSSGINVETHAPKLASTPMVKEHYRAICCWMDKEEDAPAFQGLKQILDIQVPQSAIWPEKVFGAMVKDLVPNYCRNQVMKWCESSNRYSSVEIMKNIDILVHHLSAETATHENMAPLSAYFEDKARCSSTDYGFLCRMTKLLLDEWRYNHGEPRPQMSSDFEEVWVQLRDTLSQRERTMTVEQIVTAYEKMAVAFVRSHGKLEIELCEQQIALGHSEEAQLALDSISTTYHFLAPQVQIQLARSIAGIGNPHQLVDGDLHVIQFNGGAVVEQIPAYLRQGDDNAANGDANNVGGNNGLLNIVNGNAMNNNASGSSVAALIDEDSEDGDEVEMEIGIPAHDGEGEI